MITSANVTHILEYKTRDTAAALTELLHQAQHGKLHGVVFIAKTGPRRHRLGVTGEYWADPAQALGAAVRLCHRINQRISEAEKLDDHPPDSGHAPLDELPR